MFKKFSQEYSHYLYESLSSQLSEKLSKDYSELKNKALELIEKNMDVSNFVEQNTNIINLVKTFIQDYINEPEKNPLTGFIQDREIFEIYEKGGPLQTDIDLICNNNNFFDKKPNVISLYKYVVEGCKFAMLKIMENILKELS
jgi:hypothetical protein